MKDNYPGRINLPCTLCTPRSDAETKRRIRHTEYNHSLVFWSILRYPAEVRFQHMVPVQKWHLPIRLNPHLNAYVCVSSVIIDRHPSFRHSTTARTLCFAYLANTSRLEICSRNFPLFENLPRQVPRETRLGRATEMASFIVASET